MPVFDIMPAKPEKGYVAGSVFQSMFVGAGIPNNLGSAPISASDQLTSPLPLTDLPVLPIVNVRAVPQLAVVISAEPLNDVPLIERAVCSAVAVAALPVIEIPVGILAAAKVPVVTLPASKLGICAAAAVPVTSLNAGQRVAVVGSLAFGTVPESKLEAFKLVKPEPLPDQVPDFIPANV